MNPKSILYLLLIFLSFQCSLFCQNLPAPTGLRVTKTECGRISLTWDKSSIPDTSTIYIYRSINGINGYFQWIGGLESIDSVYIDKGPTLIRNTEIFYKIYYSTYDNISEFGGIVSATYSCPPPTGLKVIKNGCDSISFSIDAYPHGDTFRGFNLLRSENGQNGDFRRIGKYTLDTLLYDEDIPSTLNKIYHYKVSVEFFNGNQNIEGQEIVTSFFTCLPINNLKITNTYCGQIGVSWENKYIYRPIHVFKSSTGEFGNYDRLLFIIDRYSATDFDYQFEKNKDYYYKIRYEGETDFSNIVSAQLNCTEPKKFNVNVVGCNQILLKWDYFASFDQNMNIYRSTNGPNGNYQFLTSWSSRTNNYIDNSVDFSSGNIYYYKIQYENESSFSDIVFTNSTITSTKTGLWTDPTVWSCGFVPTALNDVIINTNHIITIDDNFMGYAKNITNNGELIFGINAALNLNVP